MPVFAIKTTSDERVLRWMERVGERLHSPDYMKRPFTGSIEYFDDGLYVIDISPVYPRLLPNIGALSLAVGSVVVAAMGFPVLSQVALSLAVSIAVLWNVWWTSLIYRVAIIIQVRRLAGRWHRVQRADAEALRRMAHGEV